MSTNFELNFKVKNPSYMDYYNIIVKLFTKYQIMSIRGRFENLKGLPQRKNSSQRDFEFCGHFENMLKNTLLERLEDSEGKLSFEFATMTPSPCYLYSLYSGRSSFDYSDYVVVGPNVNGSDIFSFLDDLNGIFFDENFIWGTIATDPDLKLESYLLILIKKGVSLDQMPDWARGIYNHPNFTDLGDLLGNGVDVFLNKDFQNRLEKVKPDKKGVFDYCKAAREEIFYKRFL